MARAKKFQIPSAPGDADAMADQLGGIATAAEWKRAAIVYARVRVQDSPGRPTEENVTSDILTPTEYANLGIHGLRSRTTVYAYWRAWNTAVIEGLAEEVSLGDEVTLPDAEWADYCKINNRLRDNGVETDAFPPYARTDEMPVEDENLEQELDNEVGGERYHHLTSVPADETGECSPRASDVETSTENPEQHWMPTSVTPTATVTRKFRLDNITLALTTMHTYGERTLHWVKGTTDFGRQKNKDKILASIEEVRAVLNVIETKVRGEDLPTEVEARDDIAVEDLDARIDLTPRERVLFP